MKGYLPKLGDRVFIDDTRLSRDDVRYERVIGTVWKVVWMTATGNLCHIQTLKPNGVVEKHLIHRYHLTKF